MASKEQLRAIVEQLRTENAQRTSERDALAKAIVDFAVDVGVATGEQPMTGPQVLRLAAVLREEVNVAANAAAIVEQHLQTREAQVMTLCLLVGVEAEEELEERIRALVAREARDVATGNM